MSNEHVIIVVMRVKTVLAIADSAVYPFFMDIPSSMNRASPRTCVG